MALVIRKVQSFRKHRKVGNTSVELHKIMEVWCLSDKIYVA